VKSSSGDAWALSDSSPRESGERVRDIGATTVSPQVSPDFTTESTEITETDRKEGRVQIRIRTPFPPASVASVPLWVRLRIAPAAIKSERIVVSTYEG